MIRNARTKYRGLTLIEVIVSLILVSTILLVCISASASLIRNRSQSRDTLNAHGLVGQLLDEVSVRDYFDPDGTPVFGLEANEDVSDRTTFDDVDDYHNYTQTPPTYRDGTNVLGFTGWTIEVAVERASPSAGGVTAVVDDRSRLRIVTVTATRPNGKTSAESILVSNVPTNVTDDLSYQRMRRADFTFSDGRELKVAVPLRNQPTQNSN